MNGQDGSFISELLLNKGYNVHGILRRSSVVNTERIEGILRNCNLHYGDVTEGIDNVIKQIMPDEIYNFAGMSHVGISFETPVYAMEVNSIGPLKILEGIKRIKPDCKYYQASSSEMFGTTSPPQSEISPFNPVSPYGISKLSAYHLTRTYRNAYNIFACNGILFNHESERRGVQFATHKISLGAVRIKLGLQDKLYLGNLEAKRDWGYAKDYVEAIYKIMQYEKADDWVIATGVTHSVGDFLKEVFDYLELDIESHVVIDDTLKRPLEVPVLYGNNSKAKEKLNWEPKTTFKELARIMVDWDMENERNKKR